MGPDPASTIIEFFRAVPLLVVIFAVFFVAPTFGLPISAFAALVTGLTLYNMAVIAEIVRAGILSIDQGQSEAAYGIGMRKWQVMNFILLSERFVGFCRCSSPSWSSCSRTPRSDSSSLLRVAALSPQPGRVLPAPIR